MAKQRYEILDTHWVTLWEGRDFRPLTGELATRIMVLDLGDPR